MKEEQRADCVLFLVPGGVKPPGGGSSSGRQPGEPEERYRARVEREVRVRERGEQAVREKVQRDAAVLQEQAERDVSILLLDMMATGGRLAMGGGGDGKGGGGVGVQRAGDMLDAEIKKWAAGKQGNVRALLSTLQYVSATWIPQNPIIV